MTFTQIVLPAFFLLQFACLSCVPLCSFMPPLFGLWLNSVRVSSSDSLSSSPCTLTGPAEVVAGTTQEPAQASASSFPSATPAPPPPPPDYDVWAFSCTVCGKGPCKALFAGGKCVLGEAACPSCHGTHAQVADLSGKPVKVCLCTRVCGCVYLQKRS